MSSGGTEGGAGEAGVSWAHMQDLLAYFWLFGSVLVSLLQLHVQAFIGTAVHLGDRWRGSRARVAVVPAPVAAAATVRQLAATTLHVGW